MTQVADARNWNLQQAATQLDDGLWMLDLGFQGRGEIVAAWLLEDENGAALIETGPGSTLVCLDAGLEMTGVERSRITDVVVTHIHLDHAGAAGLLARENPVLRVHVHPFGAPHLVDPSKLIASATRIYGDQMEPLWGEFAPIPEDQVLPLTDDQVHNLAGRELRVLFTPGHAWHHVAIWDEESGVAITGDVGGVRMPGSDYICPPTPPPDLDPAAWATSISRLRALQPRRLLLTHYGPVDDVEAHLGRLEAELAAFLATGEQAHAEGWPQEQLTEALQDRMRAGVGGDTELLRNLEMATPSFMAAMGLQRYFTKRSAAEAAR